MKTSVTVQSITDELETIAAGAARDSQWGAAKAAVETKAKLHGLLIDRKETGQPGDFDGLKTEGEVVEAFRAEHGEEAALALAKLLAGSARPPEPAQVELVEPPAPRDTIN